MAGKDRASFFCLMLRVMCERAGRTTEAVGCGPGELLPPFRGTCGTGAAPTHPTFSAPTPPSPPTPLTPQEDATEHVGEVLERVKPEYLRRAYKLQSWSDAEDFLAQVARLTGEGSGCGRVGGLVGGALSRWMPVQDGLALACMGAVGGAPAMLDCHHAAPGSHPT